ncbi:hypothetical protein [Tahibacter amnicola]|uniref:Energy transducer TonB n=1 Tax=Tahibacter amnicola TaxID=2976241 RepID=A0ABY6BHF1_9GAMM|nr:hypothetical protein [Tahibacter amnicola]UXI67287.1 hypothetical protein N4264_21495 [Tahibacter amnicola]
MSSNAAAIFREEVVAPPEDPAIAAAQVLIDRRRASAFLPDTDRAERRRMAVAALVALLLHLYALFSWPRPEPLPDEPVLQVRLIERAEVPDALPVTPPAVVPESEPVITAPPSAATSRRKAPLAAAPSARPAQRLEAPTDAPPPPAAPLTLYSPQGDLQVSLDAPRKSLGDKANVIGETAPFMKHGNAYKPRETAFADAWAPSDESAVERFVRRATVKKSFRTPWGSRISCAWSLVIGGCGWGFAPPNPEGLKKMRVNPPFKPRRTPPADEETPWEPAPWEHKPE